MVIARQLNIPVERTRFLVTCIVIAQMLPGATVWLSERVSEIANAVDDELGATDTSQ